MWVGRLLAAVMTIWLCGCASIDRSPVPASLSEQATPVGLTDVRTWGDAGSSTFVAGLRHNLGHVKERLVAAHQAGRTPSFDILAISGGAEDAAFGAGLLAGWTEHGDRPKFEIVTGVSAGALIAPYAFLGPEYDHKLRRMFEHGRDDIMSSNFLGLVFGAPAFADSAPLQRLIERNVDQHLLDAVAQERRKGRLLLIGTTNLDAQRPVLWDMGAIAASGSPNALATFRRVLLASSAVPGMLPPVHFTVSTEDGHYYEEMHVDGGASSELLMFPPNLGASDLIPDTGFPVPRRLFVIRNGKLGAEWSAVSESTLSIAQRSLSTLIKTHAVGDLYRLYEFAKANRLEFKLAAIPDEIVAPSSSSFETGYMVRMFAAGHAHGAAGYAWRSAPPGLASNR